MVYTCYEMIRDCRAAKPEGWIYFLKHYVPIVRAVVTHNFPDRELDRALLESLLATLCQPASGLFQSLDPAPERAFVTELRQLVVRTLYTSGPGVPLTLETLSALEPLTVTEKMAVWFETMRYGAVETGRMLRMSPETAVKIRDRGAELLRGGIDTWSRTMLMDQGLALGAQAAALHGEACPPPKAFLDLIDGRTTWRGREEMERHVRDCWYCLDHYCRLLEVVELLRNVQPLGETEIGSLQHVLGIQSRRRPLWRKLLGVSPRES